MITGPYETGNPVTFTITFVDDPGVGVYFAYLVPGASALVEAQSLAINDWAGDVTRVSAGVFRYTIDTSLLPAGVTKWKFYGTGTNGGKRSGSFEIEASVI